MAKQIQHLLTADSVDHNLAALFTDVVQAKVLESLSSVVSTAVSEAINLAIGETLLPGEQPPLAEVVNRPKAGGLCAAVWDELDRNKEKGQVLTLDQVRKLAKRKKWNANNARVEYYRWRAANGVTKQAMKQQYAGPERRRLTA